MKSLLILLLTVAFKATMEMLIVFQNPEFRCHLIQLNPAAEHHVAQQGQPARASQRGFQGSACRAVKCTAEPSQSLYLFGQGVVRVGGHPGGHVEDDLHGGGGVVGRGVPRAAVALQPAHEPAVRGQVDLREPEAHTAPTEHADAPAAFAPLSGFMKSPPFPQPPQKKKASPTALQSFRWICLSCACI